MSSNVSTVPGAAPASAATEAEQRQQSHYAETTEELAAMEAAFRALYRLPRPCQMRALRWLEARLDNCNYNAEPPF